MVFTSFQIENLQLINTKDEVVIYYGEGDDYREVVKWSSDEWNDDAEVLDSVFNAINLYYTDRPRLIEILGHEYGIDFIVPIILDKKALDMIQHLNDFFYSWYEKENDENKMTLLTRLIHEYRESSFNSPLDFMEHNDYCYDGEIVKIVSLVNITEEPNIEPTYIDTLIGKEHLFSVDDITEDDSKYLEKYKLKENLGGYSYLRIQK